MLIFKEWQVVCEAIQNGTQSIILRKGGIHEGKSGFTFGSVDEFLLFPTKFHAQGDFVKAEDSFSPGKEWEIGDEVVLDTLCKVEKTIELKNWEEVATLSSHHIWTEKTIRDRFDWEGKGMATGLIHLALIRAYKLEEPIKLTYTKNMGGCRSWVELPSLPSIAETSNKGTPVLTDEAFSELRQTLNA